MNKPPSQRQLRVGEMVRHALVEIIGRSSFRDPDLADLQVTVTAVSMSPDMSNGTVFIVPFGDSDATTLVRALNRAAPFLRRELAREVDLRRVPELRFKADISFGEANRIETLLRRPDVARDLKGKNEDGDS
jgi:ribosome-binding factor A